MSILSDLFGSKVECPRCLGKGIVDQDAIKRLDRELRWIPGPCAYCNGKGKVSPRMIKKVPVDTSYLTSNLPKEERQRLIHGDEGALLRARHHEIQTNDFIRQIEYLHFTGNMELSKIVDFYFMTQPGASPYEKQELADYINKIIKNRKDSRSQ